MKKMMQNRKYDDLLKTSYAHYEHSLLVNAGSANVD